MKLDIELAKRSVETFGLPMLLRHMNWICKTCSWSGYKEGDKIVQCGRHCTYHNPDYCCIDYREANNDSRRSSE